MNDEAGWSWMYDNHFVTIDGSWDESKINQQMAAGRKIALYTGIAAMRKAPTAVCEYSAAQNWTTRAALLEGISPLDFACVKHLNLAHNAQGESSLTPVIYWLVENQAVLSFNQELDQATFDWSAIKQTSGKYWFECLLLDSGIIDTTSCGNFFWSPGLQLNGDNSCSKRRLLKSYLARDNIIKPVPLIFQEKFIALATAIYDEQETYMQFLLSILSSHNKSESQLYPLRNFFPNRLLKEFLCRKKVSKRVIRHVNNIIQFVTEEDDNGKWDWSLAGDAYRTQKVAYMYRG